MTVVGQLQKSARADAMSGLPPLATELRTSLEVRFVPIPELSRRAGSIPGAQRTLAYRRDTIASSRGYFSVFGDGDRTTL
jgi:hypothetical protein